MKEGGGEPGDGIEMATASSPDGMFGRLRRVAALLREARGEGPGPWWGWRETDGVVRIRRVQGEGAAEVIGRGRECDFQLGGPTISRRHCEVERRGDDFFLRDCGSRGGTRVNGVALAAERVLRDGDVVELGGGAEAGCGLELVFVRELRPREGERV